jgi:putative phage-type endonuclease
MSIKNILNELNIDLHKCDLKLLIKKVFVYSFEKNNNVNYEDVVIDVLKEYCSDVNLVSEEQKIVDDFKTYRDKKDLMNDFIDSTKNFINNMEQVRITLLNNNVEYLKTLFQPEQRSKEWYEMRETLFTASQDVCDILGYDKKSKYANNKKNVILKKCGLGPKFKGNRYTQHGQKYEDIACQIYESRYSKKVFEYGLVKHPSISVLGASPDGITSDGIMLEIKCPSGRIIDGIIKPVYFCQMQTQMEVCDLDRCDFFECNITEYSSYQDYISDEYDENDICCLEIIPRTSNLNHIKLSHCRRTRHGLEKGMIGTYYIEGDDFSNKKWVYPPFELNTEGQQKWLEQKREELKENGYELYIGYWKLDRSSLNIVNRDKKWWEKYNITEELYNTWEMVEEARKNGCKDYIQEKKEETGLVLDFTNLSLEEPKKDDIMDKFSFLESETENEIIIEKVEKKKKKKKKKITKKSSKNKLSIENDNLENVLVLNDLCIIDSD